MKKRVALLCLLMVAAVLTAAPVGRISYFLGDVQYKETQNSQWKKAVYNQPVEATASLKTGVDSRVDIIFGQDRSYSVPAKTTITVTKIQQELQSRQKWSSQVREKAANLSLQNKKKETNVAGIRREEAEIRKSELYWYIPPRQDIQEALDLYDLKQYTMAIPMFEMVIEQGPLKKSAEVARAMLVLIYEEQKDLPRQRVQYQALKRDFPQSELLRSMPEIK